MKRTSIAIALAAVIAATAVTFTSCGGNDNEGMTDGSVTVSMNQTGGSVIESVTDIIGDMTESR